MLIFMRENNEEVRHGKFKFFNNQISQFSAKVLVVISRSIRISRLTALMR